MNDEIFIIKRSVVYLDLLEQNKRLEAENKKLKKLNEGVCRKRKNYFTTHANQQLNIRKDLLLSMNVTNKLANSVGLKVRKVFLTAQENLTEEKPEIYIQKQNIDRD